MTFSPPTAARSEEATSTAKLARVEPLACADPLALPSLERELQHTWLVWDAWTGGKRRVDVHPFVLSQAAHREAVRVAERAWTLVADAATRASLDVEECARYRLPFDVDRLAAAAREAGDLGSVSRVDLLLREDGRFVACEVNADCPGGYNETMALPRLARAAGLRTNIDPTYVAARLADRLVARSGGRGSPRGLIALAYATAYAEDLQVCALLERLVIQRGGRTVRIPVTALRAMGDGVGVRTAGSPKKSSGLGDTLERVAVLYRFYPLEYMAGQRNIEAIAHATEHGELTSMTSFAWIHAQSKLAMARAFAHDPVAASAVFPETVNLKDLEPARLRAERESWVVKRDLSRVGDHVFVGNLCTPEDFQEILADVEQVQREADQVWIAQRYIPQASIATPWGPRLVTLGVYLVDGVFAGYFARLSTTSHCSHDSLVLPVFVNIDEDTDRDSTSHEARKQRSFDLGSDGEGEEAA